MRGLQLGGLLERLTERYMESIKQFAISVLVVLLAVWGTSWWFESSISDKLSTNREYWESRNFRTDSQRIYVDYSKIPIESFVNYVPPAIHIDYIDSTKTFSNTTVVSNDSLLLVVDSLEGVIAKISTEFLIRYPLSPKLVQALISSDTVVLDLLNIQGNITRSIYPVNFKRFRYQYINNSFKAEPLKNDPRLKNSYSIYAGLAYDWAYKSPAVWGSLDVPMRRLLLEVRTSVLVANPPLWSFQTGVGIKVK